jgi:demethylmenaquinone methyltransferase/2-methoxy-6-polyprenyl-1,4-benzoquinol methylase
MTIPYKNSDKSKKEQVAGMFNNIAHKYDFLNHVLSLGIDTIWRNRAIREMKKNQPKIILDVATGTGDFAIAAARKLTPDLIIGIDISHNMLEIGKQKVSKKQLDDCIQMQYGDCESLPFPENYFDASITGFGVRNFENLHKGLQEMVRVLKPGACAYILEFSMPHVFPVKQLYALYFKYILPTIGRIFSKDTSAYTYLYDSVQAFPYGEAFAQQARNAGFSNTKCLPFSFGITTLYVCKK